jgi:primosomal protein N' (replication factor Y)
LPKYIYSVAVFRQGGENSVYTYSFSQFLENGTLVKIPLKNQEVFGVVLSLENQQTKYPFALKEIIQKEEWQLPENIQKSLKLLSEYYLTSFEKIFSLFLPSYVLSSSVKDAVLDTSFHIHKENLFPLSPKQEEILQKIDSQKTSLLYGVTGSGKTEIFLHWFSKRLKEPLSQGLFLVPEIALTPQMKEQVQRVFSGGVAVMHSKLTPAEKRKIWKGVFLGNIRFVVGSRSSVFLPFSNLTSVVIDECHEWTYKSESFPYYHTKKVLEFFQKTNDRLSVIYASATPLFTDFFEAKTNNFLLTLPEKFHQKTAGDNTVSVVDMKEERQRKNFSPFSVYLQKRIQETLDAKKQVVLFLNRRGFSSALQCEHCGTIQKCPHCEVPFTYHASKGNLSHILLCHQCSLTKLEIPFCENCGKKVSLYKGFGTQKIEEIIQNLYPQAKVFRADADTMTKKNSYDSLREKMQSGEIDILLGTQMITKGFDFENVTCVGIILADTGLYIPDYLRSERVFQLLVQVSGRTGRKEAGEVVIQTFLPNSPVISYASKLQYENFFKEEMEIRKTLSYPPFSEYAKCTITGKTKEICIAKTNELVELLHKHASKDSIIKSSPSFFPKRNNLYYWNVFIRGKNITSLLAVIPKFWKIDRDPIDSV